MATVVSRASSAIHEHNPAPIIPQRRPRQLSIEIIDVDELDFDIAGPSTSNPNHRLAQRRRMAPEVVVIDSDDEDYDSSLFSGSSSAPSQTTSRAHSPHHQALPVELPMRRNPPPDPGPGPVMANPLASDYERFLHHRAPVRRSVTRGTNPGPSSSPSHSSSRPPAPPSQGSRAGGGIITSTQANIAARRAERELRAQLRASGGSTFRRPRIPRRATPGENMHFVGMFRADSFDPFDPVSFNHLIRYGPDLMLGTHRKPEDPHYLPSYTHPETADPGFSFDFDLSSLSQEQPKPKAPLTSLENPIVLDDDGEIVEEPADDSPPQISFVCSNCSDPLVLGEGASASALAMAAAGASAELVEAERKGRRLWGLRCGHLIDGKCLEALAYPPGALDVEKKDVKGKGKTKASDTPNDESDTEDDESSESFFTNPIRSRLRSATNATTNGSPPSPDSLRSSIARRYLPNPVAQLFGARPKRKSKPKKLKVEETYIWSCPVGKCGKPHTSVKMGGEWGPEKDKGEGAIAMFI